MGLSSESVARLVADQLENFRVPAARELLRRRLVAPRREDRIWESSYPEHTIECWMVADLDEGLGLAYSIAAHQLDRPWGVVYTGVNDDCGPDFCWHALLEDAYIGSGQFNGPLPDGYYIE